MRWNIAAECISLVILVIIWVYAKKGELVPSLKNRLFQGCFFMTFCAMSTNIMSTVLLEYPDKSRIWLAGTVTTLYYVAMSLMGFVYFCYTVATVYEKEDVRRALRVMLYFCLPSILYLGLVIVNPFIGELFSIDRQGMYHQGRLVGLAYILFYFDCAAAVVVVLCRRRKVDSSVYRILAVFPLIALTVIVVQQVYPSTILTGSAATCSLLIIYLYLQNRQNSTDYLTGLPNRQEFLKMVELQLKKGNPFSIIDFSLRGFRRVNDTFGQHKGDLFLHEISKYLKYAAGRYRIYRYSGVEFVILAVRQDEEVILNLVEEIKTRFTKPWKAGGESCFLSTATGMVSCPESADTAEELINGIEYAVLKSKGMPANNFYYCGRELLGEMNRRAKIINIMEQKLKEDSFEIYYQPIISTKTRRFVVAESLLRIPDSLLGPLYPNEFIPLAEDTGLIIDMTYQILEKVCRFINRMLKAGVDLDGVHVNFSGRQFTQLNLAERVEEIIERNGTPYSRIKIEITESILAQNQDAVAEFSAQMHKHGVLMELDDFGTGYSNIVSVMNTPLDLVKLDRSMIVSAMTNTKAADMIRSLTGIFHKMGLYVLAEGVETKEQDAFVTSCGIDYIQGFLYAKPMPEEQAAAAFLRQNY